jgi:hypothetical protein
METLEDSSRLNEVNYLEVVGGRPRVDSLMAMTHHGGGNIHANYEYEKGTRLSNTYTNNAGQYVPQDAESETTDDNGSFRTRRSTFMSGLSRGSLIFPQVAKFKNVAKNEACVISVLTQLA